ncbi:Dyp-type peroxidase [Streptomyces sp. MUM 203J]|nr:Dyp-type peroxidase [Streptomyces sp. MUM 203J]
MRRSAEIQGDILAGFRKDHVQLLFLKFEDETRARVWLKRLRPRIATTRQVASFNAEFSRARSHSGGDDPVKLNALWRGIGFTYEGLKTLTGGKEPFPSVPRGSSQEAFVQGPAHRAGMLGDSGDNSPEKWLFGNGRGQTVHAVLTIAADRPQDLRTALGQERQEAAEHKIVIVFEQDGATLEGERRGKEHFGFKDGISEPGVIGFDEPDPENPEWVRGHPGTRLIPAGEFVVGEPRVGDRPHGLPEWARGGSFQVIRRLAQDVPGWWAQIAQRVKELEKAEAVPPEATTEWLAARVVGRWRSGTPLHKCPHADAPSDAEAGRDNQISYEDDPEGEITPLFSHLRKTNPRDGLVIDGRQVPEKGDLDSRRIMRRGVPYGLPFDPAAGEGNGPDARRGLVFVCYQSDLVRQFEFIQKDWVNDPDFPPRNPKVGNDPDIGSDTVVNFKGTPVSFAQFVRTEGAVYAFAPSLSTLGRLADGRLEEEEGGTRNLQPPFTLGGGGHDSVDAGRARLVMRPDGNLVVLDETGWQRWESGTAGTGAVRMTFQEDGDIVLTEAADQPVWKSRTSGNPGATLSVQADGNVVLYASDGRVVWHTGTAH